jgi:hypothetical protein
MELSFAQQTRLSTICADIAQVSLASIAIPFLLDEPAPALALLGVATSLMFWVFSLRLSK